MISTTINPRAALYELLSREEMEGIRGGTVAQVPGANTSLPVVLPGAVTFGELADKIFTGTAVYVCGQAIWSNREAIVNAASYVVAEAGDAFITFGRDVSGGCETAWNWAKSQF